VVGRAADVRRLIGVTGQYAAVSILADAVRGLLDGQWPGPVGQSLASAVGITAVFAPLSVWRLRRRI
jgi:hypothetical protein